MTDEYEELIKLTGQVLDILREPPPITQTSDSTEGTDWLRPKGYEVAWGVNLTWHVEEG